MYSPDAWFQGASDEDTAWIDESIALRKAAKVARDFATADGIRDDLKSRGIILEDKPDGSVLWRRG